MSEPNEDPFLVTLRARLVEGRAQLARLATTASGVVETTLGDELGRRNAALFDEVLVDLWGSVQPRLAGRVLTLGGVGSYGRGAVALRSDLDLRLLTLDRDAAADAVEALLYPLWSLGLTTGHQVITPTDAVEAARDDLPTATSLLDFRRVAGDAGLQGALTERAAATVFAHSELPRFFSRLCEEVEQRHERFGGSVYLLEPDVKNGAGGLRDLDVAKWVAKARYGLSDAQDLVRIGVLIAREAQEIDRASDLLWRIRNALHARAGRRSDRLAFDEQEALAVLFGYGDSGESVERFMSAYYRAARTISRTLEMILSRATPTLTRRRPHIEELDGGVQLFDGFVTLSDAASLRADPALALRAVAVAVERGAALLPFAREAIARAAGDAGFSADLRASDEAAHLFVSLVATSREVRLRAGSVARELHDLGLVLAMIPEFSPVVGRVHHDIYHVYTVDVHSVAAVDRLAAFVRSELVAEFPLPSRLASEIARPQVLFLATLLHDVGKAIGGKDHSRRGAEMSRAILARLGFDQADIEEAAHLIDKHLLMYHVATRRDLDDPVAIGEFASEVGERETLRALYLLTVADLSTTSPTSMTSWKGRMLDDLYLAAEAKLSGASSDGGRVQAAMSDVARAAEERGDVDQAEAEARRAFLRGYLASMPQRYLLANHADAVAAHAELARAHAQSGAPVTVALVPSRHPEAAELCVVTRDRPGLLASITAALAASRLEVHAAQIHTRALEDGVVEAVDLFWVRDRAEGVGAAKRALGKLERDLGEVLSGKVSGAELARRRRAPTTRWHTPSVPTHVNIDDRGSRQHSIIEVTTLDRPGLLFTISQAIYALGLTIAVAKINTEGTRAADVFYVSEADGSKIAPGPRTTIVRELIVAALEALDHGEHP